MFVQIFEKIFAQNYPISDFDQILVTFFMKISLQYCSTFQSNLQTKSSDQTFVQIFLFFSDFHKFVNIFFKFNDIFSNVMEIIQLFLKSSSNGFIFVQKILKFYAYFINFFF